MFSQHLKNEIKKLKKELAISQEEVEELKNSKPLLYTVVLSREESVTIVADEYLEWTSPVIHRFKLDGRIIASFKNIAYFTTTEITDATHHNDK